MNSTLKSFKRTSTVLSPGVPRDRTADGDSQSLPAENLVETLSPADVPSSEPGGVWFGDESPFSQAIHTLRSSNSVAERVIAAQTLGNIGSELATPDLIACLFDQEHDITVAAVKALSAIADPTVNIHALNTFLSANRRADESTGDVECLPGSAPRSIHASKIQALMVVESPLPNRTSSTASDLPSDGPVQRASAPKPVKPSTGEHCFDDPDPDVRNAAALAAGRIALEGSTEDFALIMEMATAERRRRIARAMVDSGLATEAIEKLNDKSSERVYNALWLLSLMAKAGETQPLVKIIEEHSSIDIGRAAVKLLSISGHSEMATTAVRRRLKI